MDALAGYASDATSDDDGQPLPGGGGSALSGLAAARAAGEGDTRDDAVMADDGAPGDGAEEASNENQEEVAAADRRGIQTQSQGRAGHGLQPEKAQT